MVAEALADVPTVTPAEAQQRMQQDPYTLVIDVRDAAEITATGTVPGAINVSDGTLTYAADNEAPPDWRDPRLQDRSRPIVTSAGVIALALVVANVEKPWGFRFQKKHTL